MREGQVVWAKVTGYPWWPAVVTAVSPEDFSVAFLGEKTKYLPRSSCLPPCKVLDFRTHYDRFLPQTRLSTRKRLLHSVKLALELLEEPAPAPPTKRPASPIRHPTPSVKLPTSPMKRSTSPIKQSTSPTKQPLKEPETVSFPPSTPPNDSNDLAAMGLPESSTELRTWLERLHPADAPSHVLRHLATVLSGSELGHLARRLLLQSKLLRLEAGLQLVALPDLRRRVCRALCRLMSEAGLPAAQAKRRALHAELLLRRRDPSMTAEYRCGFQELVQSWKAKVMLLRTDDDSAGAL